MSNPWLNIKIGGISGDKYYLKNFQIGLIIGSEMIFFSEV